MPSAKSCVETRNRFIEVPDFFQTTRCRLHQFSVLFDQLSRTRAATIEAGHRCRFEDVSVVVAPLDFDDVVRIEDWIVRGFAGLPWAVAL